MITKGRREAPILGEAGKFFPITVSFELTNKCNLRCSHCYKEAQVQNNAFIPTDLALKILGQLSKNVWHLEFTGGEATLHPEFEKIVAAASAPSMVLLTNGTNLQSISSATLSRFNLIQVSLYGSSREEYEEYTETAAFDNVCKGITRLVDLGVPCCVAVILRKTNILRLGTYIQLLDELGVADVRFGFSAKVGRNSNGSTDWDLEYEDCVQFDTIIQKLKSEYSNIHFSEFGWRDQFKTNFPIKDSYKIGCEAGKKTIAISERGYVRPCVYMPAQFFERKTWDEYYKIISNGRMLGTAPCVADCLNAFREVGQSLSKICPRAFI